jgi:predicted amidohydrolase
MISETLRIGVVQTDIYWEDKIANLASLEEKLAGISSKTDIVILPEMFAIGFSPESSHLAETMNGQVHKWMKMMAKKLDTTVLGSVLIKENGNLFNRIIWVNQVGETETYDKKYLFTHGGESKWLKAGNTRKVLHWKGWAIRPLICYDLRFPTWSWQEENEVHDILIYVASWPEKRSMAWKTLLKARGIENQCYVIGVNRVGDDGNGVSYNGYSCVYSYSGEKLVEIVGKEAVEIVCIKKGDLENFRGRYSFIQDGFK